MKNKTTNIILSFCFYCALIIEYHTGRVWLLYNFYTIHGETKSTMNEMYLFPCLKEAEIFEYYQSDVPSESSFSQEIQLWK